MLDRISARNLTAGLVVLTFLVIALGGVVRIYDAGESCPDWPTCFGDWSFDVSAEEQEAWWDAHPDEIDSRGAEHRYTTFQIFTEWSHRLVAGFVLGPLIETNLRRAMLIGRGDPMVFLQRPISAVFVVATVALIAASLWGAWRRFRSRTAA
jgi:heme A synthase